jgi:hypothetical protein
MGKDQERDRKVMGLSRIAALQPESAPNFHFTVPLSNPTVNFDDIFDHHFSIYLALDL